MKEEEEIPVKESSKKREPIEKEVVEENKLKDLNEFLKKNGQKGFSLP